MTPLVKTTVAQGTQDEDGDQYRVEQPCLGQDPPEEPGVLHVVSVFIVGLLAPDAHPEEVFGLFSLVDHLQGQGRG